MLTLALDLPWLGAVVISGEKAAEFLQGQLTCDVFKIGIGQAQFSAYCDAKGRVLASFWLLKQENDFALVLPRSMVEDTVKVLKKYAALSKVKVDFHPTLLANLQFSATAVNPLYTPAVEAVHPHAIKDENLWHYYLIEAGITLIYPQTRALFTPHMLNYPHLGAVSFTKGCYIGQEIVARTHYLGKVKRGLYRATLSSETLPLPGTFISQDKTKEAGVVVESAFGHEAGESQLAVVLPAEMPANASFTINEVSLQIM